MKKMKTSKAFAGFALAAAGVALICIDIYNRIHSIEVNRITACGLIGILCLLVGGILVISSRNEKQSGREAGARWGTQIHIPQSGYVEAVIIGITRNLRMEGAREAYYIICKYTDAVSGAELTFTSDMLYEYPGREVIGKKVRVFIDPSEPEHYHIDLNSMKS